MTNTVWQQRQPVRKAPMPKYFADGDPGAVLTEEDMPDFLQEIRDADEVGAQAPANWASDPQGNRIPFYEPVPYLAGDEQDSQFIEPPELQGAPLPPEVIPGAGMPPVRPPAPDRYTSALDKLAALQSQRPVLNKPTWWQRLGAAGAAGAAGWTNAAGRTRPIDVAGVTQGVLHPGYSDKVAQWESKVAPAQATAALEGQRVQAGIAQQKMQSDAELKHAQTIAAMQHGQYWLGRSQMERNQWKIDPKTGNLYNTVDGRIVNRAVTPEDRAVIARALGATPQETKEYALNGKFTTPAEKAGPAPNRWTLLLKAHNNDAKAALAQYNAEELAKKRAEHVPHETSELDIALKEDRLERAHNAELDRIEKDKTRAEAQIQQRRTQEINNLFGPGRMTQDQFNTPAGLAARVAVNRKYAPELQNIQNNYASEARRRGIQVDDFKINPDTLEAVPVPRTAPLAALPPSAAQTHAANAHTAHTRTPAGPSAAPATPQATAPRFTESQIRQGAEARGINPEVAVQAARAKKLIP